ncbi:hypothetical protein G9464_09910 [Halostella sp. JP-L12]|uniref:hypothetical protein n=1 Tax=Halostella TaxID=1843185 RepID=UPI000EF851EF|nr:MULTISPECIES: hypothetical protein [Halostella]NHN47911.1 hypothetical protein [Halostella sp. JP-L12]
MGTDGADTASENVTERVEAAKGTLLEPEENSFKRWLLLSGGRGVVTAVAMLVVMTGFVVLGVVWTTEMRDLVTETEIVQTLLFTLLSGTILLVSIAVSINSVVLSQELTSIGDQLDEIENSLSFRSSIREMSDPDVSPARPAEFLLTILRAVRDQSEELDTVVEDDGSAFSERVDAFVDDVVRQTESIEKRLQRGQFGTSEVLLAGLDYDYSWQMYVTQRLLSTHGDELTDRQRDVLEDIVETLKQFTTGRAYFKTLYFKRELANLSRWLLAISFPSIVYLSYALLALKANLIPDISVLGIGSLILFTGAAYVAGLVPFALFTSYVLRSATISFRTLAAGPFILKDEDKRGRIDWD